MSNMNDFIIKLQAMIDESSLDKEQKKLLKRSFKIAITADTEASQRSIDALANSVLAFKQNNSKMSKDISKELDSMYNSLINGANISKAELNTLKDRFTSLKLEVRDAGQLGKSFSDSMKQGASSFISWLSATNIIMSSINTFRNMLIEVRKLDTALVDLKKTTNATSHELEEFYYSANDTAKQLGVTTEEIINATSAWSRLGYAIKDASTMAKNSAILASISPEMDIESATDGLVSVLKAFNIEAEDSLDGVISKINIIGNTQAVDNNDIIDILTRSSSAMAEANNTLEQTIALGTAATEITRDADSVGTALKTISMRIRGYDEETEEYVGGVEELSGAIADLTKTASTPGGISLFTDSSKTEYKSTYQILKDISEVYDDLTDKQQADLLEVLAGKRQGQIVSAMLNNFEAVETSMDSMANSAGNAMKEMEIIYDSMDYKLNETQETAMGIAQNLFGREDMKAVIDVFNSFLGVLDIATEKLGLFNTIALGTGAVIGGKNLGAFKVLDGNLTLFNKTLISTNNNATISISRFTKLTNAFNRYNGLSQKSASFQKAYNEALIKSDTSLSKYLKGLNGAKASMGGYIKSLVGAKVASVGLQVASVALNTALSLGLSLAINALISAISNWINKEKEARKEAIETAQVAKEEANNISNLLNQYNKLAKEIKTNQGAKENLLVVQKDLLEALDIEESQIDDLIEKYGDLDTAINQVALDSLEKTQSDLMGAINAYEKELLDIGSDGFWGNKNIINAQGDSAVKAFEILEKAGLIDKNSFGTGGGSLILSADDDSVDGVLQNYQKLTEAQVALNNAINDGTFTMDEMISNPLYIAINNRMKELETIVDSYNTSKNDLDKTMAEIQIRNSLLDDSSLPKTQEEFEAFKQSMIDTAIASNNFTGSQEDVKNAIIDVLATMPQFEEYFEVLSNIQGSTLDDKTEILSFTDQITQVQSLSEGLDQLAKVYNDIKDGADFDYSSILNNEDFKTAFGDYTEEYDNFIKTITNSPNDIKACQDAFNKLASAYIYGSEKLQGVTRETQAATVAFLEQKGITNASAIVERQLAINEEALAIAKEKCKVASGNLADATVDELTAIAQEGSVSETTANYLDYLLLSKLDLNDYKLDTTSDVNQIIAIAKAAGVANEQVIALEKVLTTLSEFNSDPHFTPVDISGYDEETLTRAPREWVEKQFKYAEAMKKAQAIIDEAAQSKFDASDFYANVNLNPKDSSSNSSKSTEKETKKPFDWIETKLSRIQRNITNFGKTVSSTYLTWSTRNKALLNELSQVNKEITTQKKALDYYTDKADSVKLSKSLKKKVKNGSISISEYDEKTAEKIEEYQKWYEKILETKDAITDLKATEAELIIQAFDNITAKYDSKISTITAEMDTLNAQIDQVEAKGHAVDKSYYNKLIKLEKKNLTQLEKQLAELNEQFDTAMDSGKIKKGSEEYNRMKAEIEGVETAIVEANTALIEYNNTIRDLEWEKFDKMQESISAIADESDFLKELMSDEDMFDENGITKYGQAMMGLHASNYNTYMTEADRYGKELLDINKQLAKDPNNQTLLDRRNELIDAQRQSILAAKDEVQSLMDLKKEGYDNLLDSLDKIIQKKKDMFSEIKEERNFAKTIEEQVKAIDEIEKQLLAYKGDTSEAGKSATQQLKVKLEEAKENLEQTEYEKYISDQEKLLDSIYDETSQWINERMDNEKQLLTDIISEVNANSNTISKTLQDTASSVGTTLSEILRAIWAVNGKDVVSEYGSNKNTNVDTGVSLVTGENKQSTNDGNKGNTPSTPTPSTNTNANNNSNTNTQKKWGSWFESMKEKHPNDIKQGLDLNNLVERLMFLDYRTDMSARRMYFEEMQKADPSSRPPYSTTYSGHVVQDKWMIEQMKKHGFAKGGTIGSAIKSAGEDGFVLARTGEEILSLDKIKELGFTFEKMYPIIDTMKYLPNPTSNINNSPNINIEFGDTHVSLPNVHNADDFARDFKQVYANNIGKVKTMVQNDVLGASLGKNSMNVHRY